MYAGQVQPIPLWTTAAHIPQQGLIPAPPKVPANAPGTAYRPHAPLLRLPGESPYAARLRNAGRVQKALASERKAALAAYRGFATADADAAALLVTVAEASQVAVEARAREFAMAGKSVDESTHINTLVDAHHGEVAANVAAAAQANRAGRLVPMMGKSGQVVMVDPATDPAAASAAAAQANGNPVAVKVGNPLAAAALAVTPAMARAAARFGQSAPNAQTALLAKAQQSTWLTKLLWGK